MGLFSGSDGERAKNLLSENQANRYANLMQHGKGIKGLNDLQSQYAQGGLGLQDLMGKAGGAADQYNLEAGQHGEDAESSKNAYLQNLQDQLATDPLTGSQMATDQVRGGLLSGTFGHGGTLDRTGAEEQRLASSGFSLQPEDHEAYGQASGNIARLFGAQGNALSQNLADRGLASAQIGRAHV